MISLNWNMSSLKTIFTASLEPIRIRHFTRVKVLRCCARVLPTTSGALEPCDPPYVISSHPVISVTSSQIGGTNT